MALRWGRAEPVLGFLALAFLPMLQAPAGAEAATAPSSPTPLPAELLELVYSVNRVPELPFDTTRAVEVITAEDIWLRNARTLPELLMEAAGVFVQQTNYGSGSPVIRGLIGKQILIFLDGVRVNNATYRFGPLQYLNTIDLAMVDRIEIVRGVESVLGSDSLGGIINIVTKKGPSGAETRSFGGLVTSRYSGGDSAATARAEAFGRTEKLRFILGGTYRESGAVRAGGDAGTQRATGYPEGAGNLRLEYSPDTLRTLHFSYQGLQQNDVPRTDRILDGTNLRFSFDPQRLQLATVGFQDFTPRAWAHGLEMTLYFNRQDEGRFEVRAASPNVERRYRDRQTVWGANLQLASVVGSSHRLVWGLDFSTEGIDSLREDANLTTGALSPKRGQYTDGASYGTFAAYLQDRITVGERLTLGLGGRFSRYSAGGSEITSVGRLDLGSDYTGVTGSAGAAFRVLPRLNLVANLTRGFRPPNLDDLSVFEERSGGTEIPNPDVSPERSLTWETGLKVQTRRLSGSAFYYRSSLTDLLVRTSGQVEGRSFFDLNDNGVQDKNEPNVQQKKNLGEARISGVELNLTWAPLPDLSLFGNFTRTVGDDELEQAPLQRIPPPFGTLGTRWSRRAARYAPWLELVYCFAAAQRRLSPLDAADPRVGPRGTDGFNVFHLRGGFSAGKRFRAFLALENFTDQRYKYHGSGIYRPGLQAVLGAEYRFGKAER
jgi:outer membrane receptor protein involved in Fe transport